MEMNAAAAWITSTFAAFDRSAAIAVHELYNIGGGFFTPFFNFISLLGKLGIFLIILSLALMFNKSTRRVGTAMLLGAALGAVFTNLVLKIAIARPRPFADEQSIFYQIWLTVGMNMETDKSFPSGHVTAAVATMLPPVVYCKPGVKLAGIAFALLMCVSRIYLMVHFPSDVLGGIVTGLVAGLLGVLIAEKLPEKYYEKDLRKRV